MSDPQERGTPEGLTLDPGETLYLRTAPSKNLLLAGIGGGMVLLVCVSVVVAAIGDIATGRALSFAVVILVVAILGTVYHFVHRWEYAMTSDRVCVTRGWRSRDTDALPLDAVEEVAFEQSWWQRLVNVGDLQFVTNAETLRFGSIENPRHVYERALARIEER